MNHLTGDGAEMAVTTEQYEHWKDFSIRMARTCFKRKRNPDTEEIEANVEHFFDCLDPEDLKSIVDWDHSDPYPEGSPRAGLDYGGHPKRAMLVTDMCKEHADGWNPYYWYDLSETEEERRDDQFCGPVLCCIRAGLDMAVSPSVGVMGFAAGDLRRMYPGGVPDWITGGPNHRWMTQHFDGVVPDIGLLLGKSEVNGTFAEMPDAAELWL